MSIDKIMTETVISVEPEKNVRDVRKLMIEYAISQVPVIEQENVIGMVSENEILLAYRTHGERVGDLRVNEIMASPPPVVDMSTPIERIVELLVENHAVLISENVKIRGIITRADVVYWLIS